MNKKIAKKTKRIMGLFALGFLVLFCFRFIYGTQTLQNLENSQIVFTESVGAERKNYASKKYKITASDQAVRVDQKYEKIAEIRSKTSEFEKDEKLVRAQVSDLNGLIQYEQKQGNHGNRHLNITIGVPPENFDTLYLKLTKVGTIKSKQITKTDKTNEYKELNAKKASLEKTRASLLDLKSNGGAIEEYIHLENRILDIEDQLQALGVSLGNFDAENEFCTVRFSLSEGIEQKVSLLHRIKVALEWTLITYMKILIVLFLITMVSYLGVLAIDKLKLLQRINKELK